MTVGELLNAAINSLNKVEVKGEENLNLLLATIKALKTIVEMQEKQEVTDSGGNV